MRRALPTFFTDTQNLVEKRLQVLGVSSKLSLEEYPLVKIHRTFINLILPRIYRKIKTLISKYS